MNEKEVTPDTTASPTAFGPSFERVKSRIHNKRFSPAGTLFFKTSIKTRGMIYSNVMQVNCVDMDTEKETAIFEAMEETITKKYKL